MKRFKVYDLRGGRSMWVTAMSRGHASIEAAFEWGVLWADVPALLIVEAN